MTEEQWKSCLSPEAMLNFLTANASPRKLRLYAIGCCRRIWSQLRDDRCRHAIEVAQRFADGKASLAELAAAERIVASLARIWGDIGSPIARATFAIGGAAWATTRQFAWHAAWDAGWDARMVARDFIPGTSWERERVFQAELLHDLFGNPFDPVVIERDWILANDGAVNKLAQVIYEEGRFGDLPILADALEEAGCDHLRLLEHARARQVHYRGCWVVDAILNHV
ncbi:MAG: hypothetical protein U0840_04825 [Gemmataceae bacterium]